MDLRVFGSLLLAATIFVSIGIADAQEVFYMGSDGQVAPPTLLPEATSKAAVSVSGTDIAFTLTYQDVDNSTGIGFDDPVAGAQRRSALEDVLRYIDGVIDSTGGCDILVLESYENPGISLLATAGPLFFSDQLTNGFAFEHIMTGADPYGPSADIQMQVNFGHDWYIGAGVPGQNQMDFFSTLLHELTHGLGVISLSDETGALTANSMTYWDSFLRRAGTPGTALFVDGTPPTFQGTPTDLISGDLVSAAPLAAAAYGAYIPVYSPSPFENGSSLGHFDNTRIMGEDFVMFHQVMEGTMIREYHAVELALLEDIGYSLDSGGVSTDDYGNDAASATLITDGTLNGILEVPADVDVFKFSAVANTTYTFETGGSIDSLLVLLDVDGNTQLASDDDGAGSNFARIIWTCPADGTYYVAVGGYSAGSYSLTMSTSTPQVDDHGNTAAEATVLTGTSTSGTIEVEYDVDWFKFSATQNANYEFTTGGALDTVLFLYDTDGLTELDQNDDVEFDVIRTSLIRWTCPASGDYYLAVAGYETATGAYTLNIDETLPTPENPADVTGDNAINASDVQAIINAVLGVSSTPGTNYNVDGLGGETPNAADIQFVINAVLNL